MQTIKTNITTATKLTKNEVSNLKEDTRKILVDVVKGRANAAKIKAVAGLLLTPLKLFPQTVLGAEAISLLLQAAIDAQGYDELETQWDISNISLTNAALLFSNNSNITHVTANMNYLDLTVNNVYKGRTFKGIKNVVSIHFKDGTIMYLD